MAPPKLTAAQRAAALAETLGVGVVASGDVRCARPADRALLDTLTCLLHTTTLEAAGRPEQAAAVVRKLIAESPELTEKHEALLTRLEVAATQRSGDSE